ncbi:MAG: hypothetical protein IIA70_00650 [Proteobacteria bacterium]|nr:hypothetical protein [Pseudomonadota bacterium]
MRNRILAAATALAIGFGIGGGTVAQEQDHSAAMPEGAQHEMMQNMMQSMHQCMKQMKEGQEGMSMHSRPSGENDDHASGDMMQSMMEHMMKKMESCMMQMEASKDEGGSHDH